MLDVLQVGRVVGGHFRLQSRLGEGDTGRLWAAEDVRAIGVGVVVEFMPDVATSASARVRFEREGRAWLAFHCPQVARVIDQGVVNEDCAFRVIERLHGETLERVLTRERSLRFDETALFVEQLCHAIVRLEASGLRVPVLDASCVFVVAGQSAQSGARGVKLRAGGARPESRLSVPEFARLVHRMLTGANELAAGEALPSDLDDWFRTALHEDRLQRFSNVEQAGLAFGHIARGLLTRQHRRSLGPTAHPSAPHQAPAVASPTREARLQAAARDDEASGPGPRTDDPAAHVVMIDPGVLGPRSNRGFRKRTGLALSALVAIALGAVGGFVLRTALQNGVHLAHRGEEPGTEGGSQQRPEKQAPAVVQREGALADRSVAAHATPADGPVLPRDARVERAAPVSLRAASVELVTVEAAAQRFGHVPNVSIATHGASPEVMPSQAIAPRAVEVESPTETDGSLQSIGAARLAPAPRVYRGF